MRRVEILAALLLLFISAAHAASCKGLKAADGCVSAATDHPFRRLLDGALSGLTGPSSFLSQTKRADSLTAKDLQETSAHAGDFQALRPRGRDRRLLDGALSGLTGPSSFLSQTKRADSLTAKDLQETSAHAGDFQALRPPGRDRRLLDGALSGLTGPSSFLSQTKRADSLTAKDLQETSAHAGDFQALRPPGRDRRLLLTVPMG